jgi:hypothetical protein
MSGLNIQNSRVQQKYSTISGQTPTIAPSSDHTDGTWSPTDLYVGEIFFNTSDDAAWFRSLNGIVPLTSGASYVSTYVNKTGDTMSGGLIAPSLSAATISGNTILSNNFQGTYYGDGSNLTGITATVFTGGTISGPTIFTDEVDFCSASISASTITGCDGELEIFGNINVIGSLSATTLYGDGSNLTNLPYLSGVTLDNVLTQGDTSTNGNIVLTNGDITLTNGVFIGDGSGLTNIPFGAIPTLDDVLQSGNTSTNYDINLTNGNIVLANGIYYGDGSGLTNLIETTDIFVTGGTYDNATGTATFTNNTGDTFTVTGFTTGVTSNQTLEETLAFGDHTGTYNIFIPNSYGIFNDNGVEGRAGLTFDGDGTYLVAGTGATYDVGSKAVIGALNTGDFSTQVEGNVEFNMDYNGLGAGHFTVYGYNGFSGAQYSNDYSANYTNRSLVDKEYVDSSISGFTTGSTLAQTLVIGNTTDGNNIIISSGDTINSYDDNFKLDLTLGKFYYQDVNKFSRLDIASDELNLEVYDSSINKSARIQAGLDGVGDVIAEMRAINSDLAFSTAFSLTTGTATMQSGAVDFGGIKYDIDYSANYENRSLVDKEYVDNATTGYTYITEDTGAGTLNMAPPTSITSTVTDGTVTNEDYNGLDYSKKSYDDGIYTSELILDPQGNWDQTLFGEKHTSGGTAGYIRFSQGGEAIDITTTDGIVVTLGTQYSLTNSNIVTTASNVTNATETQIIQTPTNILTTATDVGFEYFSSKEIKTQQHQSQFSRQANIFVIEDKRAEWTQTADDTTTLLIYCDVDPLVIISGSSIVQIKAHVRGISSDKLTGYAAEIISWVRLDQLAITPITQIGTVDYTIKSEFTTASSSFVISGPNMYIDVTGEVGVTIDWTCNVEILYDKNTF